MVKRTLTNPEFWAAIALAVTALAFLYLFHPGSLIITINPVYHWFSWIGASYIAIAAPLFHILKHRYSTKYQMIVRVHIFGNLAAFLLISLHSTYQTGNPPILGTFTHLGLTLYIALLLFVITGFILRYQLMRKYVKSVKFIHTGLITAYYLIIIIHVLHGLDII